MNSRGGSDTNARTAGPKPKKIGHRCLYITAQGSPGGRQGAGGVSGNGYAVLEMRQTGLFTDHREKVRRR